MIPKRKEWGFKKMPSKNSWGKEELGRESSWGLWLFRGGGGEAEGRAKVAITHKVIYTFC